MRVTPDRSICGSGDLGMKGFLLHGVFCSLASDRDVLDAGRPRVDTVCASRSGQP